MLEQQDSFGLAAQLYQLQSRLFRGRLDIEGSKELRWSLYFYLGRLVWAGGGANPSERWHRLWNYYFPDVNQLEDINLVLSQFNEYELLAHLLKRDRNKRSEVIALVQDAMVEVIFDILQCGHQLQERQPNYQLAFTYDENDYVKTAFNLVRVDRALKDAKQQWQLWQQLKLTAYSPNLVLTIEQPERLRQNLENSMDEYWILTRAVDGTKTLRSLALELQQPLPSLTLFFVQYVNSDMMSFKEVQPLISTNSGVNTEDTIEPSQPLNLSSAGNLLPYQSPDDSLPLVICIDDSPIVCTQMRQIITGEGCRFTEIQDPMTAIPKVLKSQPDLIFLDLIMPIVNGYELCAQIRRISQVKNTPIVILTGQDGLIDRVRSKIVGASEFIAKPIEQKRVLSILRKYGLIKS